MFWIFKYIVGALLIIRIEILVLSLDLIGIFVDYYLCIVSVLSIHVEKCHPRKQSYKYTFNNFI